MIPLSLNVLSGFNSTMSSVHSISLSLQPCLPTLEFLLRIALFLPFSSKTWSLTSPRQCRLRKFPYQPMLLHILSAAAQFLYFYYRYISTSSPPRPDRLDLVLSGTFIVTSFLLIGIRARRHSNVTRTTFQTTISQHALAFILGYWKQDADLFCLSVRFLSLFSWFRMWHRLLPRLSPLRFKGSGNYVSCYDTAIVISTFVTLWEVGYPGGAGTFAAMTAGLMWLERTLAMIVSSYPEMNLIRRFLVATGIIDFEALTGKDPDFIDPATWKKGVTREKKDR